jgi:hypothetical protein
MGVTAVYWLSLDEPRDNVLPVAGISLCLAHFGYWFGVRPHRIRNALEKVFRQSSGRDEMIRWELSRSGLSWSEPSGSAGAAVGRTV